MSSATDEKIVGMIVDDEQHSAQRSYARTSAVDHVLTDGGYVWVCVVAVFLINAHTWGVNICYSVFLSHYLLNSTLKNATDLDYSVIGGMLFSMPLSISPLAIKVVDKFEIRTALFIGVVLMNGSLIGASFATDIWHLYVAQGLGFPFGVGFFFVACQNIICQWFTKRRGLASGLAATGTGVGGLTYALAAGHMIDTVSTGMALRIIAIISFGVTLVASIFIRDRNEYIEPKYSPFDLSLLKKPRFILLFLFLAFNLLGEIIILTQIPSYGAIVLNLSGSQVSIIGAMMALGQILGRASIGAGGDIIGRLNIGALVIFLAGFWTVLVWPLASSFGVSIFYSIRAGAFAGSLWAVIAVMTAEVMGLQDLPSALPMLYLLVVAPTTFSPVIGSELIDATGGYLGTQLFAGFMFIASSAFAWILRCYNLQAQKSQGADTGAEKMNLAGLSSVPADQDTRLIFQGIRDSLFDLSRV